MMVMDWTSFDADSQTTIMLSKARCNARHDGGDRRHRSRRRASVVLQGRAPKRSLVARMVDRYRSGSAIMAMRKGSKGGAPGLGRVGASPDEAIEDVVGNLRQGQERNEKHEQIPALDNR